MHYRILVATICVLCAGAICYAADNELTAQEKKGGWQLIFDGKSTKGWMSPKKEAVSPKHVEEGALNPHPCDYMLVYERPLKNFVVSLDFKVSEKCNSGIFVRTAPLEPRPGKDVGFNGIEIAIDDTQSAGFHDTGAIYDLVKPEMNAMKPAGQWNHIEITCNDASIEIVLNDKKVSSMNLDAWTEVGKRPDGSAHKFDVAYKNHPREGYLGLQDHGGDCWYRNIKLRVLK